jgi:predicted NBD/HSP70 family sugar kinase
VEAAQSGRSPILAQYLAAGAQLTAEHVGAAASAGDKAAMELIKTSGTSSAACWRRRELLNPSLILIGGGVANIGTQFLATIRRGVLSRRCRYPPRPADRLFTMSEDAGVNRRRRACARAYLRRNCCGEKEEPRYRKISLKASDFS